MPEVKFGKKTEGAVSFRKSDDLIAVRTRSARSLLAGPVLPAAAAELRDGQLVLDFPEAGVEVYRVPTGRRTVTERKLALRGEPDVRFAGGVLVDDQSGEPVVYTENLFLKFVDSADPEHCREVIREAGLAIKQELTYAANAFFVTVPEGTGTQVFDIALGLLNRDDVEYCHPEIVRRRNFRAIAPQQWHLKAATVGGTTINAHVSAEPAHLVSQGAGVTIAVIDDGVDIDHPEFSSTGKIVAPRNATSNTGDPRPVYVHPQFGDNHGTACAGVACADGQAGGASGVAPKARLMPIRLVSGLGSQQEANAFVWAADQGADVISCSWGPSDGYWADPSDPLHHTVVPLPANIKTAIDYATTQGRNGKGCVVLFAAGNGNESVDNDGYASYERVIAVAACNDRGKRSVYSDFGAAVWCAFPSNDIGHPPTSRPAPLTPGIWTTDWTDRATGPRGYLPGNYTDRFGGTSSACPGAAGVAALVLAVNPDLSWQEVRDVLRRSCDRIDPDSGQYDEANRSKLYGYGRLNALTAVQLAPPPPRNTVAVVRTFDMPLPDLQLVSAPLDVAETHTISDLTVEVEILHTYIGDLVVTLVPPPALGLADIPLHTRAGGSRHNLKQKYDAVTTPALVAAHGKSPNGVWTLQVQDVAVRDEGTLVKFGVVLTFPNAGPRADGAANGAPAPRSRRSSSAAKSTSKK